MSDTVARTNIERIIKLEEEEERDLTIAHAISSWIGRFVGTVGFVAFQIALAVVWIAFNAGATGVQRFDPFPFPLLGTLLAFESVLLTGFVLIRQNRTALRADRRNHLELQINLLAEQETTKVIQMLQRMSEQMGIESEVADPEARELARDTAIEGIAGEIRDRLDYPDNQATPGRRSAPMRQGPRQ